MPRFKEPAICIRHLDWSETSQVVVMLTRELGKLRGLAKGSKRMSPSSLAKFSGGVELLTRGQVCGVTKKDGSLATITEWDLQEDHHHLRRSLPAWRTAMYAADVTHALLADLDPHPGVYDALAALLRGLHEGDAQVELLRFQWALLVDVGYRPELEADVHTGEVLPEARAYTFDPTAGGLTTREGLADWRVRRETVELLRQLAAGEAVEPGEGVVRANKLLCSYVRSLLDKALPTMGFVLER